MLLPPHQESAARLLARIVLPATLVAAVVLGALVWWWTDQSQDEIRPALASTTLAQTPDSAGTETSVAVTQLELARTALLEGRLLSPAGNNAVEYYLRALETEADASGARQALLELIPEATLVLESTIESGELAEAERELALRDGQSFHGGTGGCRTSSHEGRRAHKGHRARPRRLTRAGGAPAPRRARPRGSGRGARASSTRSPR